MSVAIINSNLGLKNKYLLYVFTLYIKKNYNFDLKLLNNILINKKLLRIKLARNSNV